MITIEEIRAFVNKDTPQHGPTLAMVQTYSHEATYSLLKELNESVSFKIVQPLPKETIDFLQVKLPFGNEEINMSLDQYHHRISTYIKSLAESIKELKKRVVKVCELEPLKSVNYQYRLSISGLSATFYTYFDGQVGKQVLVMTIGVCK
jgi:hypothetical protein